MLNKHLNQFGLGLCSLTATVLAFGFPSQANPSPTIAQACSFPNTSQFVRAITRNFEVYICGGDTPHQYVGVARNGSGRITLPLVKDVRAHHTFVAVNGNFRYVLTRDRLTITRGGRVILSEPAVWQRFG